MWNSHRPEFGQRAHTLFEKCKRKKIQTIEIKRGRKTYYEINKISD